MSFDERQKLIIMRVREVFASKGLEGATTRELAKAAGVSEGLLFTLFVVPAMYMFLATDHAAQAAREKAIP